MWKPSDWLRLVCVVGAFLLFAAGVYLLQLGIAADGLIDIKSSLVSGTLKTGSAGLFLCFFAFLLIVFVLLSSPRSVNAEESQAASTPRHRRLLLVFYACLASTLAAGVGAAVTQSNIFFILVGLIGGAILPGVVTALIRE